MGAHFDAAGRLARSQHDRDGASLGVVDMDRQKAALVVVRIEQRELLMAATSQVSSKSRMTLAGARS